MEGEGTQVFVVTINWTADSDTRLTEGDLREVVEEMVGDLDEEATVDVVETLE